MTHDPSVRQKFNVQRADAKRRGVPFLMTIDQWWSWWQIEDRWSRRGRGQGRLVMARYGDVGPYELGNIYAATHAENMAESAGPKRSAATQRDWDAKKAAGKSSSLRVRGAGHPRSQCVITPDGTFESGALAADHYGVTKEAIYYRIKKGVAGFRWAVLPD